VRSIGWIIVALAAAAWWGCQTDVGPVAGVSTEESFWRRTSTGWERRDRWHLDPAPRQPLHPVAIASLQLVAALGLLVQQDAHDTEQSAAHS
jgi:hypothetical protein